jgi:FkbM family methyltransferase
MLKSGVLRLASWAAGVLPPSARRAIYRLGPISRGLRRLLNQAVPAGRVPVEVAAGLLKGMRFELELQEEKDLWLGTYELALQAELGRRLKPGMVVFDVGAHIGYMTLGFARLVGPTGRVLAFEPLPDNQVRLQAALTANQLASRVSLRPAAVSDREGRDTFQVHRSASMGKLAGAAGREEAYQARIEVPSVRLDDEVYLRHAPSPDWIKLDVEGGEGAVLAGSRRLLAEGRPGWWIELHGPASAGQVWRHLTDAGYVVFTIDNPPRPVESVESLDWKAYLLALPEETSLDV